MNPRFTVEDVVKFQLKDMECIGIVEYVDTSYPGHIQYEIRITCPRELADNVEVINEIEITEASHAEQILFGSK